MNTAAWASTLAQPEWGRIGPNAITRVAEVLPPRVGSSATWQLFERAGLLHYLRRPPQQMVREDEVRALHGVLREQLGPEQAAEVARAAGRCTAEYLLKHRIPRPLQRVLRWLPAAAASRVLLSAITRHSWTFAGSGEFSARPAPWWAGPDRQPLRLTIRRNPLCRDLHSQAPACDYYSATFQRLFEALVHPGARVQEISCEACGDPACCFEVRW